MEKNSAPFSMKVTNLKRYFDQRLCPILKKYNNNGSLMKKKHTVIGPFKKSHYLWSKYRFKLSPPTFNGSELFSMIVPPYHPAYGRV